MNQSNHQSIVVLLSQDYVNLIAGHHAGVDLWTNFLFCFCFCFDFDFDCSCFSNYN